jgi:hypothetical protein
MWTVVLLQDVDWSFFGCLVFRWILVGSSLDLDWLFFGFNSFSGKD